LKEGLAFLDGRRRLAEAPKPPRRGRFDDAAGRPSCGQLTDRGAVARSCCEAAQLYVITSSTSWRAKNSVDCSEFCGHARGL